MALRAAHGTGAKALVRVETLPANELPSPVPVEKPADARAGRGQDGRFDGPNPEASRGGRAKAGKTKLALLGLRGVATDAFKVYRRDAEAFRKHHCSELAALAGGVCSSAPSSMVASASLQLAASRYLFDLAGTSGDAKLFVQASILADKSRQSLLTAYELATREAAARPHQDDDVDRLRREVRG